MRALSIAIGGVLVAGCVQAGLTDAEVMREWQYNLPETGLMPSYGKFEWFARMGERHGGSDLSMHSYALTLPLSDPRRTGWGRTMVNVQFDFKLTAAETGGTLALEHDLLYNIALPITFITKEQGGNTWTYGLAPELATDCHAVGKGMDLAAYVFYSIKKSETFSYSLGLAASPRFAEFYVVPMLNFEWKPSDVWTIRMKGYKLEALYHATERLSFGPFIASRGGVWSVETERGDRIFRVRSLVLGANLEYDFSSPGQTRRIITAAVGSTLTTNAQFLERNADKDAFESHHYKPGLYVSLGVDFRF